MMLEIAVTAIVRASLARQADPLGHLIISVFHSEIQARKFFEQGAFHYYYFFGSELRISFH
jgi:hypothetical protein